ncbi:hypothetical protein [Actinoplanes aureus]|uniref:Uncharacterized protein n=1 Tax=Actinoplanes aureus TaxID=2792083 RepID=A0A931C3I6_9ACTN|nr:hypothetical protein [Actinoplanes aureus]MBG0560702.1 hypothetical protein [Actinoplanes aureus]
MRKLHRRNLVWRRYAERTAWNPRHTPPIWAHRWISDGQWRAWVRLNRERERRQDIAARRWWPQ